MRTLTKRQVGQTPALLWASAEACAQDGEAVYVLHKGRPAYRVEYIADDDDPLASLRASGIFTPPSSHPPDPPAVTGDYSRADVAAILDDLRAER